MIKRGRISVLMLLLAFVFVFYSKAKAFSSSEYELVDLTYEEYEGVIPRQIYYDTFYKLSIVVDNQTFNFDTTGKGEVFLTSGDSNGTIWINIQHNHDAEALLYWTSYELEGSKMSLHYFGKALVHYSNYPYVGKYVTYTSDEEFNLPNLDELSKLLNDPNAPVEPTSQPTVSPTNLPIPTIEPTISPSPVIPTKLPSVVPTEKPDVTVSPTKKPIPTKLPTSTPKVVKEKISKSKKTKAKVYLLSNTGKVLKEVKFNKKTGVMVYNKKKIKKVKDVFFTKKGTVVYFTKSKKAYYFIGKKRILIKSKVSSIKTYKGLATQLVIKKGKKAKSIKLKK